MLARRLGAVALLAMLGNVVCLAPLAGAKTVVVGDSSTNHWGFGILQWKQPTINDQDALGS
jgi:hypothetical protein